MQPINTYLNYLTPQFLTKPKTQNFTLSRSLSIILSIQYLSS